MSSSSAAAMILGSLCLLVVVDFGFACLSSGVCGGGGGCAPMAPPPPMACGGGCQPGYSCGSYGCYQVRRARARSSNTFAIPSVKEFDQGSSQQQQQQQVFATPSRFGSPSRFDVIHSAKSQPSFPPSPNEAFMACCEARGLPDACLAKCSFNTYTRESLMSMYFRTDACPIQAASEIQYCAAQGRDHTACCARNGVTSTISGVKCLTFCDQRPGNVTQLDFSYVGCYDRFEQMKACFWHGANRGY